MQRIFKVKVIYSFKGYFTLRAASGREAVRLVSEQCGTVLNSIHTTLGEEAEVDWEFDKHPYVAIRNIVALPETIEEQQLTQVRIFRPGQRVFWCDPDGKTSGYYTVFYGNDEVEELFGDEVVGICSGSSEAEVYPHELRFAFRKR